MAGYKKETDKVHKVSLDSKYKKETDKVHKAGLDSEYKKETDKVHKVDLDSKISQVVWGSSAAGVGEKANFEVWTQFVGNGSEVQVKVQDQWGKTLEKLSGKVYGDYFGGSIIVPEKAKEALIFTAKLSKHGIEKKSGDLKVLPARTISNAKWGQKEARRGDVVKLTADTQGIPDETEVMIHIFEHDQDGAHDFITKFPVRVRKNKIEAEWEFEYHESTDDIPTDEEMKKTGRSYNHPEYFFIVRANTGQAQSELLKFNDWLEFEVKDDEGATLLGSEYVIHLPNGKSIRGRVEEEGTVKIEDIPPGRYRVAIRMSD